MNQEPDESVGDPVSAVPTPAEPGSTESQPPVPAVAQRAATSSPNLMNALKPDEYPTLAASGEVDLNYRLGGLILDELIALPFFALYFVPGAGIRILAVSLSTAYWLSRDAIFGGQSLGKRIINE